VGDQQGPPFRSSRKGVFRASVWQGCPGGSVGSSKHQQDCREKRSNQGQGEPCFLATAEFPPYLLETRVVAETETAQQGSAPGSWVPIRQRPRTGCRSTVLPRIQGLWPGFCFANSRPPSLLLPSLGRCPRRLLQAHDQAQQGGFACLIGPYERCESPLHFQAGAEETRIDSP